MILSLPEIEFEVMSVSSSSAVSAGPCASTIASRIRSSRRLATSAAASLLDARDEVDRLEEPEHVREVRQHHDEAERARDTSSTNTAARGTNSVCSDSDSATPTTHVTT